MARVRNTSRSGYEKPSNTDIPATDISPPEFTMSAMRDSGESSLNGSAFTHDQIADRAFELYEQSGRKSGCCEKNWTQAEVDLSMRINEGA